MFAKFVIIWETLNAFEHIFSETNYLVKAIWSHCGDAVNKRSSTSVEEH